MSSAAAGGMDGAAAQQRTEADTGATVWGGALAATTTRTPDDLEPCVTNALAPDACMRARTGVSERSRGSEVQYMTWALGARICDNSSARRTLVPAGAGTESETTSAMPAGPTRRFCARARGRSNKTRQFRRPSGCRA